MYYTRIYSEIVWLFQLQAVAFKWLLAVIVSSVYFIVFLPS